MIYNQRADNCNRQLSMETSARPAPGARTALGLLLAINLFNYIDRQVLASVEPEIRAHFFRPDDPNAMALVGLLATAFLVSYMISAPIFGWLADRMSRWLLIGASVILWSAATAASGLAGTFTLLLITRLFVGIGEGGYGPAAPTIIADLFPLQSRGRMLSFFYVAIPVGSALGYAIGGFVAAHWNWQTAFYVVAPPGLLLGLICFSRRDPRARNGIRKEKRRAKLQDYLSLFRTRSYVLNTLAMTALTFSIGGLSFWVPGYLEYRHLPPSSRIIFGGITVFAGLTATLLGGLAGDRLRKKFAGSYFLVSGVGILIAFPFSAAMLFTPFPAAWALMFIAIFFLFFNTGPSNTALANVTHPSVRATAFAMNILIIHALGDALAPPLIGAVADHSNLNVAFLLVSATMLIAGVLWLIGMKYLPADTAAVENAVAKA
ncbi:MAG: transporter, Spinster family, sphingosine-phosphate transporter [Verrucomicrobiota bacterium]|jgi:MFS family permease